MDGTQTPAAAAAFAARYGCAAEAKPGPWNDTIALLLSHRSVRGFRPDPLPEGTLETLIAAAQSAATSSNLQTWSAVAVNDPATRRELAAIAGGQKHIEQCPLFLVFLADISRNARLAAEAGTELAGLPFLESFLVAAIDAALAAQNAVVAAESLGLGTVYIGALRNDVARVARLLGLPPGAAPVFGLCVGHALPGREGEVKPRLPQAAVLHHETYDADDAAHRAAYDPRMAEFSRRNEMADDTWTKRVIARLGTLRALNGRDRLKEALIGLGFPLR
jgi:nitroreductase